jgi:hypothetical protein
MSREDAAKPDKESDDERALDQQIAAYLKIGVPLGTLACAIMAGLARGAPAVMLVLTGGTLVAVIAIFWASIRTLVGETPLSGADAYALGAPRAAEEQKRAVLRALKDVEFERSVGKISEDDYQTLVAKYRGEAKRLLRSIDEDSQPERDRVESLVTARLRREGLGAEELDAPDEAPDAAPKAEKPAKKKAGKPAKSKGPAAGPAVRVACAGCGTKNDADAVFCKKCGARQGAAADDEDEESEEPVKDDEARS